MPVPMRMTMRLVRMAMRVVVGMIVRMTMGMAMIFRPQGIPNNLFHTARLMVVMTMGRLRRAVVSMFCMRYSRIEGMRKLRPHVGFLRRIVGISPSFSFQVKSRCRK